MKRQVLVLLVCMAVLCSGCTYDGTLLEYETTPTSTTEIASSSSPSATLPSSYGPLGRDSRSLRQVEEVFRSVESLRKMPEYRMQEDTISGAPQLTILELRAIAKETHFSPVRVSGCNLKVLKAFVASDWVPVVVIKSPVGPKHTRAVVGYDDSTERLTLADPIDYAQLRVGYSEFSNQWSDPQKACLLVFSQYIGAEEIRNTLKKYLPEEEVEIDSY